MVIFSVLIGLSLFSGYSSRSLQDPASIKTLNYDFDNVVDGSYSFNYESSDGSSRQEFGHVLLPGTKDEHMKVNGSYSYFGSDGIFYEVRYTADDQGFHPEGDHIKVPPFVPWIHRHGQQSEANSNTVNFSFNQDTFNTVGTTPSPTTQYKPQYTPTEDIQKFSTTSKPTTQYLPLASNNENVVTGESVVKPYKPRPTKHYLPTATDDPVYRKASSNFQIFVPDPDITSFSIPKPFVHS